MNSNMIISENSNFKLTLEKEFENFENYSDTIKTLICTKNYLKLTFHCELDESTKEDEI